jgi:hypothetical protein
MNIKNLPPHIKPILAIKGKGRYKGARQNGKSLVWASVICFKGKNYYLGSYDREWDAAAMFGEIIN